MGVPITDEGLGNDCEETLYRKQYWRGSLVQLARVVHSVAGDNGDGGDRVFPLFPKKEINFPTDYFLIFRAR
jgi:hypothetical protein